MLRCLTYYGDVGIMWGMHESFMWGIQECCGMKTCHGGDMHIMGAGMWWGSMVYYGRCNNVV